MLDVEPMIVAECDELRVRESVAGLDWGDVLVRAGLGHRRRRVGWRRVALVVVVLLVIAAPALALRHQVVNFFTASHSPRQVVDFFGQMQVLSFPSSAPGVLPHRARQITTVSVGQGTATLSVAPTRSGGYCDLWTLHGRSPITATAPQCWQKGSTRLSPIGTFSYGQLYAQKGANEIEGSVQRDDVSLRVQYADGTSAPITYTWVTAPIKAGFFYYQVPDARQTWGRQATLLTVSAHGHVLAIRKILNVFSDKGLVTHVDRWGTRIQMTSEANWPHRHLLTSFNEKNGVLIEFWTMPSRRSSTRRCYYLNPYPGGGCVPIALTGAPLQLTILSGESTGTTLLFGEVAANVHTVILHFQDGASAIRTPTNGFLLTRLPQASYPPGHRLTAATAFNQHRQPLFTQHFQPTRPGSYPCVKPHNYGYGVHQCP